MDRLEEIKNKLTLFGVELGGKEEDFFNSDDSQWLVSEIERLRKGFEKMAKYSDDCYAWKLKQIAEETLKEKC